MHIQGLQRVRPRPRLLGSYVRFHQLQTQSATVPRQPNETPGAGHVSDEGVALGARTQPIPLTGLGPDAGLVIASSSKVGAAL